MKKFEGYTKGINLGGWLSQCEHTNKHYDTFISKEDIKEISSWGLDHIRLPIDYELIQNNDGTIKPEGFTYIDNCLNWCKEYKLNMILDLHKTNGYVFDDFKSCNNFFTDPILQSCFFDLWEELSIRYCKYSNRMAFELLNEIVDENQSDAWNKIARHAISIIRQFSKDIPIIVGGVHNNSASALKYLDLPIDNNIIYTFHFYEPLIFTHQSAYWIDEMPHNFHIDYPALMKEYIDASHHYLPKMNWDIYENTTLGNADIHFLEELINEAITAASKKAVPLYCGEYGIIDRAGLSSTLNWYKDMNYLFKKYKIGHAVWNYRGKDFGLTDEHYSSSLNKLISLL